MPRQPKSFFDYAFPPTTTLAGKKKRRKDERVTTQAVGEETGAPPPPGKTTPAMGEEGVGDIPTTTIAKGEEQSG